MICLFLFPFSRYNDWKKKSLFKWSVLLKYWLAYQQLMIRKNWNDTLDYNLSVLCQHSYILQFSIYLYLTFFDLLTTCFSTSYTYIYSFLPYFYFSPSFFHHLTAKPSTRNFHFMPTVLTLKGHLVKMNWISEYTSRNSLSVLVFGRRRGVLWRGPLWFSELDVFFYFKGFLWGISQRGPNYRHFVAVRSFPLIFVCRTCAARGTPPVKFVMWGERFATSCCELLPNSIIGVPFGFEELFVVG